MKTHPWLLMPPQAWPHMAFLYINCRVEMILSQCSYTTQLTLASLSFLRVFNSSTSTKNITEVSLFNLKKAVCWNINRYQFVFLSRKKKSINQSNQQTKNSLPIIVSWSVHLQAAGNTTTNGFMVTSNPGKNCSHQRPSLEEGIGVNTLVHIGVWVKSKYLS